MADDIVTRLRTCNPIHDRLDGTMHTLLAAADEIERLRAAIDSVITSIDVEGRCPPHHRAVMAKHRYEWPLLWRAIDRLREARRG